VDAASIGSSDWNPPRMFVLSARQALHLLRICRCLSSWLLTGVGVELRSCVMRLIASQKSSPPTHKLRLKTTPSRELIAISQELPPISTTIVAAGPVEKHRFPFRFID
jgi:hypothetical protein